MKNNRWTIKKEVETKKLKLDKRTKKVDAYETNTMKYVRWEMICDWWGQEYMVKSGKWGKKAYVRDLSLVGCKKLKKISEFDKSEIFARPFRQTNYQLCAIF